MGEAPVKIVVKRLSAFKFAVEVNGQETQQTAERKSVIQRAPPAGQRSAAAAPQQGTVLLRHALSECIVEVLLFKLLGEQRLRVFCGYPAVTPCTLLRRVLQLSSPSATEQSLPGATVRSECNGTMACFLEQVAKFLKVCAPNEDLWNRFGWKHQSEEAILRQIYIEELSPHLNSSEVTQNPNIAKKCSDIQMLLEWERQGATTVQWRQADNDTSPRIPRHTSSVMSPYKMTPQRMSSMESSSHRRRVDSSGIWESRVAAGEGHKMSHLVERSHAIADWRRGPPHLWSRPPRPVRLKGHETVLIDHGAVYRGYPRSVQLIRPYQ